jgi:uncharacterized membrane protein YjfL (UPF0719 family)
MYLKPDVILSSLVYALMGIIIFCFTFYVVDKITPGHIWHELIEKHNIAVAIVAGCVALGICIIVAAAIH